MAARGRRELGEGGISKKVVAVKKVAAEEARSGEEGGSSGKVGATKKEAARA